MISPSPVRTRLSCGVLFLAVALMVTACGNSDRNRYSSPVNSSHYQDSRKGGLLAAIFGSKQRDRRARQAAVQPVTPARPVIPATQINHSVLASTNSSNSSVMIDVARQKVFLLKDGSQVALEAPISSARPGKTTPRGTFKITEKIRTGKISTIYDVHMPNWMRLSGSAYGVHAGYLPGYPASAGCVRLPSDAAAIIYDHVGYGTRVTITDGWVGDRVYVNLSQDTFRY